MQWVFETLGVDKQADVSAVRKAYAKAIKQCDQATEADRFQRIRQAYEFALQWARQREAAAAVAPVSPATPLPGDPSSAVQPSIAAAPGAQRHVATSTPPMQPTAQPHAVPLSSALQPIASPVSPPVVRAASFKAGESMLESGTNPSPDHGTRIDDARASVRAVLHELLTDVRRPNVMSMAGVLAGYANDVRLTSLDAKADFEQALLAHVFVDPVDVPLLDAACDLFAWETSHRHFDRARSDLVMRMLRQQSLRHVLETSKPENREDLELAVRTYKKAVQQKRETRVEPWQIVNANRLLDRFAAYRQELGERYDVAAFDWWRQKLTSNSTLLARYQENRPAQQVPQSAVPGRTQRTTRKRGSLLWLWPIFAIVGTIVGHVPSSAPGYDPGTYTSPAGISHEQPPAPPAPPTNDPYLMDVDALRHAAGQGNPTAQNYLGVRYENGEGVLQDSQSAAYWFRLAAEQGFPEAQFRLGELYKEGNGLPQSTRLAVKWWQKAAGDGNVLAQNKLALAYAKGDGVKKDYQAAYRWWKKAAYSNVPDAEAGLGWLYGNGYGVPRDVKAAVNWYRKAAAQGSITGQVDLALMYEHGEGVPVDPVIADALLTVATEHQDLYAQGGRGLTDIDRSAAKFTPAQHSAASQIARELSSSPRNFLAALDAATRFRHPM